MGTLSGGGYYSQWCSGWGWSGPTPYNPDPSSGGALAVAYNDCTNGVGSMGGWTIWDDGWLRGLGDWPFWPPLDGDRDPGDHGDFGPCSPEVIQGQCIGPKHIDVPSFCTSNADYFDTALSDFEQRECCISWCLKERQEAVCAGECYPSAQTNRCYDNCLNGLPTIEPGCSGDTFGEMCVTLN